MEQFKQQAASEVGDNLKQGCNGGLTSRESGSVGGQMVKNVTTVRTLKINRIHRSDYGHRIAFTYKVSLTAQDDRRRIQTVYSLDAPPVAQNT